MRVTKPGGILAVVTLVIGLISTLFIPLRVDHEGLSFIKHHEAFVPTPYLDKGKVWTQGYGFTYLPGGEKITQHSPPMTREQAEQYLRIIIFDYEYAVHDLVDKSLTQSQFNALVSFTYNCGIKAFSRSTLLKKVNNDPEDPSIKWEFLRWTYVKGKFSRGLYYRRQKELELYFSQPYLFPEPAQPIVSFYRPDSLPS